MHAGSTRVQDFGDAQSLSRRSNREAPARARRLAQRFRLRFVACASGCACSRRRRAPLKDLSLRLPHFGPETLAFLEIRNHCDTYCW
jgi:hypothetical protein